MLFHISREYTVKGKYTVETLFSKKFKNEYEAMRYCDDLLKHIKGIYVSAMNYKHEAMVFHKKGTEWYRTMYRKEFINRW